MAKKENRDNAKLCAILSYLLIGVIWYFVDDRIKKSKFTRFHVKQAVVLFIVEIAMYIVLSLLFIIGWILMPLFSVVSLIFTIIGIINAANDKEKELPIIGQYAKKLNF